MNNNAGPPFRDFRQLTRQQMIDGVIANMVAAVELTQKVIDPMAAQEFGRIVNITSGSVKMPLVGLDLSSGARAGLTAFLAGIARSVAASNVTINFLLPGTFDTERSNIEANAKSRGISFEQAKAERMATVPARRFGTAEEFGATCAFLCSAQAGYITGQNTLLDGGAFPGGILSSRNGTRKSPHNQQDSGATASQREQGRHMPAPSHPPRNRSRWHSTAGRAAPRSCRHPVSRRLHLNGEPVHGGNFSPVVARMQIQSLAAGGIANEISCSGRKATNSFRDIPDLAHHSGGSPT